MPGETEEQASARVKTLQEAVRRSKEIDEGLQETKKVLERRKKAVKILLLGIPAPPSPWFFSQKHKKKTCPAYSVFFFFHEQANQKVERCVS